MSQRRSRVVLVAPSASVLGSGLAAAPGGSGAPALQPAHLLRAPVLLATPAPVDDCAEPEEEAAGAPASEGVRAWLMDERRVKRRVEADEVEEAAASELAEPQPLSFHEQRMEERRKGVAARAAAPPGKAAAAPPAEEPHAFDLRAARGSLPFGGGAMLVREAAAAAAAPLPGDRKGGRGAGAGGKAAPRWAFETAGGGEVQVPHKPGRKNQTNLKPRMATFSS